MNRKNYALIAEVIKSADSIRELTDNLATVLKMDNPRFDRDKFLKACGF